MIRVSRRDGNLARLDSRLQVVQTDRELEFSLLQPTPYERFAIRSVMGSLIRMIGKTTARQESILYWRFRAGTQTTDDIREIERLQIMDDAPQLDWRKAHRPRAIKQPN